VTVFEVVGVNTTLMALAVGYIYGRRYSNTLDATIFATVVSFVGVCIGCMVKIYKIYNKSHIFIFKQKRERERERICACEF
jgi:hypothetical protein